MVATPRPICIRARSISTGISPPSAGRTCLTSRYDGASLCEAALTAGPCSASPQRLLLALRSRRKRAHWGRGPTGSQPKEVADGVFLLRGLDEHLSAANGGNIANVVFMTTGDGVVLFDTGPSRLYGEELKEAIKSVTLEPVRRVIVSHAHPDHYLGSQIFEDLPIEALPAARDVIADIGDFFTDNMYRLVDVWMRGHAYRGAE